jgi:hypothetical protein
VFLHALSGAASFAACLRLFRSYPLAVNFSYPDDPERVKSSLHGRDGTDSFPPCYPGGWHRSIVLRHRAFEGSGFYVLSQDPAEHFTLRPWNPAEGDCQEIRPGTPVPVISHRIITEGMPVPRDGALLGWVSDRQATALLSVYYGRPAAETGAGQTALPQVRVLAMVGSEPMRWPPFTVSPLDDGRFWEYVERGEIVDLAPVVVHDTRGAFWVPSQNPGRASQGHGCVVISRYLQSENYWVPAGIYMDHWMLREGVPNPPAGHLLTLPGATDLSCRLTAR